MMSGNSSKKVLVVCYHFPPSAAVGGIRAAKFCKYLPGHGWQPIVLTVAEDDLEETSPAARKMIPEGLRVVRAPMWPGLRQIYLRLRGKSGAEVSHKEQAFISEDIQSSSPRQRNESLASRIKRFMLSLMWLPDDIQGWYPPGVSAGVRLFKEENFDAVLATGPPWTSLLIGRRIACKTGRPFAADFRDPWLHNPWKPYWVVSKPAKRLERRMEAGVVQQANRVICNTSGLTEDFQSRYSDLPREHFFTLTNGYDPDDYQDIHADSELPADSELTIAYAGNLYGARNPEPVFKALARLKEEGVPGAQQCRLHFIGTKIEDRLRKQAEGHGLAGQVDFTPQVPRQECLRQLARAHVLLLLQPEARLQVPAKVFEYMQLHRPVLTIAGKGATQELIEETGTGVVVDSNDVDKLSEVLKDFLSKHQQGKLLQEQRNRDYHSLEFSTLAGRLADLLNEITH